MMHSHSFHEILFDENLKAPNYNSEVFSEISYAKVRLNLPSQRPLFDVYSRLGAQIGLILAKVRGKRGQLSRILGALGQKYPQNRGFWGKSESLERAKKGSFRANRVYTGQKGRLILKSESSNRVKLGFLEEKRRGFSAQKVRKSKSERFFREEEDFLAKDTSFQAVKDLKKVKVRVKEQNAVKKSVRNSP